MIIVGLLCTPTLQVRANEPISSMEYVPPQLGLVKLYYRTVASDPERRLYTNVSIMDVTRQGLTGHYRYGLRQGDWAFQRLLTACDFFGVYWEVNGKVSISASVEEARVQCEQVWPLEVGDTIALPNGDRLAIEQLAPQMVLLEGQPQERLAYAMRRRSPDGRSVLVWSAQGVGTIRYEIDHETIFHTELMMFDHTAQGHLLGRCISQAPADACLCAATKASTWLSGEALDDIVGNVQLAWRADLLAPVTPGEGPLLSRVNNLSRVSRAGCGVDVTAFVY